MERAPVTPDAPLYATRPGRIERTGAGRWRWLDAAGGAPREVDEGLARVAAACDRFDAVARHAQRVQEQLRLPAAAAMAAVQGWIDAGIGIEARAWFAVGGDAAPPLPEPRLVVRAYERPQGLRRLLQSLAADAARHGVRHRCLVVDDTRDADAAQRTREVLAPARSVEGLALQLLGPAQRAVALDWLLDAVPAGARPALLPMLDPGHPTAVTGARTWNWAVLAAAGGALSILDDDVGFPLRRAPQAQAAVQCWDSNEADTRFYDAPEGWRDEAELEHEPYAWLARWIGRPAGTVLAQIGFDPAGVEGRRPADLAALRTAPVVGAVPGLYGSIALDTSAYLVYSNRWSQASLWQAPFRRERLEAENLWHGYRAPRLVSYAAYTPLLLDARELLPFAGTWGRVDDTYFLMLLRAIAGPLWFAHLPVALGHHDVAPRRRLQRAMQALPLDRNAFLADLFLRWSEEGGGGTRAQRLGAVGERCAALATQPDMALEAQVRAWRVQMRQRLAGHLEAALARHPEADARWREIAIRVAACNRDADRSERIDPAELACHRSALAQAAAVAPHWPQLWQRMRDGREAFDALLG